MVVKQVVKDSRLGDDMHMFQHGCDSLQATWIRNTLLRAVRDSRRAVKSGIPLDTRSNASNFVYQYPTIRKLSAFICKFVQEGVNDVHTTEEKVSAMKEMVEKYSSGFPSAALRRDVSLREGKVVLLTGTTGGLGSNILATLVDNPSVERVYALNRGRADGLRDRMRKTLVDRGLGEYVPALNSGKVVLLEGDCTLEDFDLEKSLFAEVRGLIDAD